MTVAIHAQQRFHSGELAVQRRAGVAQQAARLEGMLARPRLDGGAAKFLAEREFAVVTARDGAGRLWTSPLPGRAGYLQAHGSTVEVHASLPASGPLAGLTAGQLAGLIAVEFAIRRRFRVNGTIAAIDDNGLTIEADQAFGNCPSYIQQRALTHTDILGAAQPDSASQPSNGTITTQARSIIEKADTFFLGTVHPERGADSSGSARCLALELAPIRVNAISPGIFDSVLFAMTNPFLTGVTLRVDGGEPLI